MPSCLVLLFSAVVLHDLRHKIPHGFCSLILHLPGGVGVGAEGEARIVVSQHAANGLYVYAVLEGQGGEGVPLWHNKDKSKNPCIARATPHKDNNKTTVESIGKAIPNQSWGHFLPKVSP